MQSHHIPQAMYDRRDQLPHREFLGWWLIGVLGDEMNGFPFAKVRGLTLAECVINLAGQALPGPLRSAPAAMYVLASEPTLN